MIQISFKNVSFQYIKPLFEKVTFAINAYDKIGVVGANGSGKSTLLDCIRGVIEPNSGKLSYSKHIKFGFVPQEIPKELYKKTVYQALTTAISKDEVQSSLWRVDALLDEFQAPLTIRQQSVEKLSGGWKQLTIIGHTFLTNPDILLLDEPTNHLDLNKIILLEKWLKNSVEIPIVTVSHDRQFLENCTNKTLIIKNNCIAQYDYSYEQAIKLDKKKSSDVEIKRAREEQEINRLRKSAHALFQIGANNHSVAAAKKASFMYKRVSNLEEDLTAKPCVIKQDIKLSYSSLYSKLLFSLKKCQILTPDGTFLFNMPEFNLSPGDRIVILGENGSGKSIFLNYIQQKIKEISNIQTLKIGHLNQTSFGLGLKESPQEYLIDKFFLKKTEAIKLLNNAGFTNEMQNIKIAQLSPGQRKRIALLELYLLKPNLYIMDEPTNHLDIAGCEQLEAQLIDSKACAIIVTHDRKFAKKIATKVYKIQDGELYQTQLIPSSFVNAESFAMGYK